MATIKIKYVGKKKFAVDNVAGSKKVWEGEGDIQDVTDAQARTLLKYPDQWALVSKSDAQAVAEPQSVVGMDEDGTEVSVNPDAFTKPLEKMNKPELVAYAKEKLGIDLDPAMQKKQMIDRIEEAKGEAGIE